MSFEGIGRVKTYRDVFYAYKRHPEHKSHGPDESWDETNGAF